MSVGLGGEDGGGTAQAGPLVEGRVATYLQGLWCCEDTAGQVTGNGRRRQRAGGRERLVRVAMWDGGLPGMGIESRGQEGGRGW
jgi:hypothetical protein